MLIFNLMFFLIVLNFFIGKFWTKQSHWGDHCHFYTLDFVKVQPTNHRNFLYIWDMSQSLKGNQQNSLNIKVGVLDFVQ